MNVPVSAGKPPLPTLVIHGGAGTVSREQMTPERERAYHEALAHCLRAGQRVLLEDGSALAAVVAAVVALEDCPLFNAGHGAVLTSAGHAELDAAVMDGRTRRAGAVGAVTRIRNPVRAALEVMRRTPHVLLAGPGADAFALAQGLDMVEPDYFVTEARRAQLARAQSAGRVMIDHDAETLTDGRTGTVGAVAVDSRGEVAAATSTGGLVNKLPGRVGDTPVPGAGTYADNATAAVSGTGKGEAFMLSLAAHKVAVLMEFAGLSVQAAVERVASVDLPRADGQGGLIAVDAQGNVGIAFGTTGMYRGIVRGDGTPETAIYR
ncbi:MAG: isoaspartyl peptidase/L-asparaginase family protein [Hyphomicrobiaceae bacterium]